MIPSKFRHSGGRGKQQSTSRLCVIGGAFGLDDLSPFARTKRSSHSTHNHEAVGPFAKLHGTSNSSHTKAKQPLVTVIMIPRLPEDFVMQIQSAFGWNCRLWVFFACLHAGSLMWFLILKNSKLAQVFCVQPLVNRSRYFRNLKEAVIAAIGSTNIRIAWSLGSRPFLCLAYYAIPICVQTLTIWLHFAARDVLSGNNQSYIKLTQRISAKDNPLSPALDL